MEEFGGEGPASCRGARMDAGTRCEGEKNWYDRSGLDITHLLKQMLQ